MKWMTRHGMIDPFEPAEWDEPPSADERAAAEAEWNAWPPAWVATRTTRPLIPPMPAEHAVFLGRVARLVYETVIDGRSIERVDARMLWCAVVLKEAAPGLVARLRCACDALVAAGEVAVNDWRIVVLRAVRAEPSPGMWSQL